uniref:Uncharacterized protein n=1 Tax=Salix viminalis TaxID=40686 RepID=A0A6N2KQU1_SALVM
MAPTRTRKIGLTRIAMQIGYLFYCNRELETESMERDRGGNSIYAAVYVTTLSFPSLRLMGVSAKQQKNCRQRNARGDNYTPDCRGTTRQPAASSPVLSRRKNSQIPCPRRSRVP